MFCPAPAQLRLFKYDVKVYKTTCVRCNRMPFYAEKQIEKKKQKNGVKNTMAA